MEKRKPTRIGIGRKTEEWIAAKRLLKQEFEDNGIMSCEARLEGCSGNYGLTFAHRYKRTNPRTRHVFEQVALFCLNCHEASEYERDLTEEIFMRIRGEYIV